MSPSDFLNYQHDVDKFFVNILKKINMQIGSIIKTEISCK